MLVQKTFTIVLQAGNPTTITISDDYKTGYCTIRVLTNLEKLNSLSFPSIPDVLINLFQTNTK